MSRSIAPPLALVLSLAAACTTLGPTPATTGLSAAPAGRPEVEVQVGLVPGHYLSSAVAKEANGAAILQAGLALEPDRLIKVPGLVLGARVFGQSGDTPVEPVIGYRRKVGQGRVALGGFAYGTAASATRDDASYEATRFGAELAADVDVLGPSRWAELHAFGGVAVTRIEVDGDYCVDAMGQYGVTCPEDGTGIRRSGHASGVYPAGHVGVAGAFFRHRPGVLHGVRLAALAALGTMPRVIDGEQTSAEAYFSIGLLGSIAIGGE